MTRSFLKYQLWALLWALVILYLSGTPGSNIPRFDFKLSDKIVHAVMYGLLVLALLRASIPLVNKQSPRSRVVIICIGIAILYGILMEVLQATLFIGRSFDVADIVANTIGVVLALPAGLKWILKKVPAR